MKCIIVTGATRGLGKVIAEYLLRDGYIVVGTGRASTPPDNWEEHENLHYRQLDLDRTSDVHGFIREVVKSVGSIYGLVNNAAIGLDGVLATMHETDIEKVIRVNVLGSILLTKYAIRNMLVNGTGRVVNISSIIGSTGFNGLSVYGATKSAMQGFTRSLARELGKADISVNTVSPGYMATDMSAGISEADLERIIRRSPLRRLAEPVDVAEVVSLLISDKGRNITGVDYVIDGGSTV